MPIPIHGAMTRPATPDEGLRELADNALPWDGSKDLVVTFSTSEFTSICPTTGQPDFATIVVRYRPHTKYLESKAIKFWLWSFRDHGAHVETLAVLLRDHLVTALKDARMVIVEVTQVPRGGIGIKATSEYFYHYP